MIGSYAIGQLYIGQSYPTLGVPGPTLAFFEGDPVSAGHDTAAFSASPESVLVSSGADTAAGAASMDTVAVGRGLEGDPASLGD